MPAGPGRTERETATPAGPGPRADPAAAEPQPARVTIGTIEVTVVPPAPPPPTRRTAARTRVARQPARPAGTPPGTVPRRWFGTGQI